MLRSILVVALLATTACARPAVTVEPRPTPRVPADTAAGERFVVVYRPGPAWRAGRKVTEQDLRDHYYFLKALFEAGKLTLAGPFLDDTGGMAVFRARDRAEAERTLATDPAVVSGVLIGELRPFRAAFDAAQPPPVGGGDRR